MPNIKAYKIELNRRAKMIQEAGEFMGSSDIARLTNCGVDAARRTMKRLIEHPDITCQTREAWTETSYRNGKSKRQEIRVISTGTKKSQSIKKSPLDCFLYGFKRPQIGNEI